MKCEDTHAHTRNLNICDCFGDAAVESLAVLVMPCGWLSFFYHLSGKTGVIKSHPEAGCVPNCATSKYQIRLVNGIQST